MDSAKKKANSTINTMPPAPTIPMVFCRRSHRCQGFGFVDLGDDSPGCIANLQRSISRQNPCCHCNPSLIISPVSSLPALPAPAGYPPCLFQLGQRRQMTVRFSVSRNASERMRLSGPTIKTSPSLTHACSVGHDTGDSSNGNLHGKHTNDGSLLPDGGGHKLGRHVFIRPIGAEYQKQPTLPCTAICHARP